jgi:hypothetical protein
MNGKDVKGSGRNIIYGTVLEIAPETLRKTAKKLDEYKCPCPDPNRTPPEYK